MNTEQTPMEQIEEATKAYRYCHDRLTGRVEALQAEIDQAKRRKVRGIKSAVRTVADARSRLHALLAAHPECFEKPRTVTIAGVRVGYMKQKGKIEFDDADKVVAQIRKHYPEQFDALVKTTERPVKKALESLSVGELKRLGCRVEDDTDEVVIKSVDTEIDKLVSALLAEAEQWEEAA